jgi:hypothetical protein
LSCAKDIIRVQTSTCVFKQPLIAKLPTNGAQTVKSTKLQIFQSAALSSIISGIIISEKQFHAQMDVYNIQHHSH